MTSLPFFKFDSCSLSTGAGLVVAVKIGPGTTDGISDLDQGPFIGGLREVGVVGVDKEAIRTNCPFSLSAGKDDESDRTTFEEFA